VGCLSLSIRSLAISVLLGLSAIPSAKATIVGFDFDASLQTGALAGTTFLGTGSYDTAGVTGVGEEFVALTSLQFSLLGVSFTESDIRQGGQAILEDGLLSFFTAAFFPPPPVGSPVSDIAFGFGGPGIIGYITPPADFGAGTYTLSPANIPEPAPAWTFGLALLASLLGARGLRGSRRQRSLAGLCFPDGMLTPAHNRNETEQYAVNNPDAPKDIRDGRWLQRTGSPGLCPTIPGQTAETLRSRNGASPSGNYKLIASLDRD
jgi:hypothetical protein